MDDIALPDRPHPIMQPHQLIQALSQVPGFNTHRLEWEQYDTPPETATSMLLEANRRGHLQDLTVADLGCGTGRLAIGAALLGARAVEGVEVDEKALAQARETATTMEVIDRCTFSLSEVSHWQGQVDTVIMNPPFGSQRKRADRPFMEKALNVASHIHTLHLGLNTSYWETTLARRGIEVETVQRFNIELPYTYPHHTRSTRTIELVHLYIQSTR